MARRKLVTVTNSGVIPELRGIGGPILHPQNITIDAIRLMVTHGKKVFEHNPANPSEKIRLTIENVESDNFKKVKSDISDEMKTPYRSDFQKPEKEVRIIEDSFGLSDEVGESCTADFTDKKEEVQINGEFKDNPDRSIPVTEAASTDIPEDSVVILTEEAPVQLVVEQSKQDS